MGVVPSTKPKETGFAQCLQLPHLGIPKSSQVGGAEVDSAIPFYPGCVSQHHLNIIYIMVVKTEWGMHNKTVEPYPGNGFCQKSTFKKVVCLFKERNNLGNRSLSSFYFT